MTQTTPETAHLSTPLGWSELQADASGLRRLVFLEGEPQNPILPNGILVEAARQLTEYFTSARRTFELPLSLPQEGFQAEVWRQLLSIPAGSTCAYEDLALQLGDARLARAVGAAIGANPLLVIVPCHRVVGKSGALTGYAGGLWRKDWLLKMERGERGLFG